MYDQWSNKINALNACKLRVEGDKDPGINSKDPQIKYHYISTGACFYGYIDNILYLILW